MILIAHRGNVWGRIAERENRPDYLMQAVKDGFDIEVDIWYGSDGLFYSGHNHPQYELTLKFIEEIRHKAWFHLKTVNCFKPIIDLKLDLHYFFHQDDACTLTSNGFVWCHSSTNFVTNKSILLFPELSPRLNIKEAAGICSDCLSDYMLYD